MAFVIVLMPRQAVAGHLVGAEISYKWISGNTYEITLTIYRDCASPIPAPNNPGVRYSSVSCNKNNNVNLSPVAGTGIEITSPCSSATTTCNGGIYLGIKKYVYTGTVTLSAQCSDWVFGFDGCCRNCDITTVPTPGCAGAPGTYVQATLNNIAAPTNSSPVFTNLPMSVICMGQPFQYNNGVIEPNGDSLVYSFISPQELPGTNVSFLPGYTATSFVSSSPGIALNTTNGDITINATAPEISITAILVKEYRNGVLVGSVIRDVQVWTIPCTNQLPSATGINGTTNFTISACAGVPINFYINSADANPAQTVTMSWNNGITGATFTSGGNPFPTGNFSWTPSLGDVRTQPYTFSVTVKDNACPLNGLRTYSYSITVASAAVVVNATNSACAAPGNGTASATASGTAPFTYLWSPGGANTSSISGLTAGNYTVTVTESHGCSATKTVVVNSPPLLIPSIAASANVTCNGANDGSIAISVAGGVAPYTYNWSPLGGTGSSASNLPAGPYTISITDVNLCTQIINANISQPPALSSTINTAAATCNGSNTGSATITLSGGVGSYSYFWSPGGNTNNSLTNATAGNYSVTATDAAGCTLSAVINIQQPTPLLISTSSTPTSCSSANGTATTVVTGGVPPYTYQWINGSTASSISGLAAGAYSVVVNDANGCTTSDNIGVSNLTGPTLALSSVTPVNCNGNSTGSASVSVLTGVHPLSYQWSPSGGNSLNANGLLAGAYTLTVTDGNNCSSVISVDINEPPSLSMSVTPQNPTCYGLANGSVIANVSGGIGPYSYAWSSGGSTSATLTNAIAGTYSVTVTDSKGCTYSSTSLLSQPPLLTGSVASTIPVSCSGGNNGEATVAITGGSSPYNFDWSPTGGNLISAAGLSAGNYSVTITDANNCTISVPVNINQPLPLSSTMAGTQILCNGAANGTASVSTTGGISPYQYSWSSGITSSSSSVTNLLPGSYSVIVTDDNGCSTSSMTTITEPPSLTTTLLSVSNSTCFNSNNGSGAITASGGIGPYSYSWSPTGGNSSSSSGLSTGLYTITITDANQCTITTLLSINEPAPIIDSANFTNVKCYGVAEGSAYIVTNGGSGPYSYLWDTGDSTSSLLQITAGNYSVTITDATGCTATHLFNITQPSPLTISPSVIPSTCGNLNGAVNVNVGGGIAPYTFLWNQGGATSALIGLDSGTYSVLVIDSFGCGITATMNVGAQPSPQLSATLQTDVLCFNDNNGSATVAVTGGTGQLQYQWSPSGGMLPTATGLAAGLYSVLVTDANNCTVSATFNITQPNVLNVTSGTVVDLNCYGEQNGQATVLATGGTGPYQYLWSPSNFTTATVSGLSSGSHTAIVTDTHGCLQNLSVNISEPQQLISTVTTGDVSCNGKSDGSASVNIIGGTGPYSYAWNPSGISLPNLNNLIAGSYSATITDSHGCTTFSQGIVNEPSAITVTNNTINTVCGQSQGSATLQVSGGNPPYNYLWNPGGMSTPAINNLSAGSYTATITDSRQCSYSATIGISNFNGPIVNIASASNVNCQGGNDGQASVNVSSGSGPYVFQWSPSGGNSAAASNLIAGNYIVQVTDLNQCITSIPVIITEPQALSIAANVTPALCDGSSDGIATANVAGGVSPYQYIWSSGSTTAVANNLAAGPYSVSVTDNHGCTSSYSVSIGQPPAISLNTSTTQANCNAQDGSAIVVAAGGSPTYNYQWSSGSTLSSANFLGAGIYSVTVTDAHGCTASVSATVTELNGMTLSSNAVNTTCYGSSDGSISVLVTGGIMPLVYNWTPSTNNSSSINNLQAGSYSVNVLDVNGCSITSTISVGQPSQIITNFATNNVRCHGSGDGSIVASLSGGTAPYTYSWNNGANTSSVNNLMPGIYTVTVTDALGCNTNASATVNSPAALSLSANNPAPICIGQQVTLSVNASGGTSPYTYSWQNGPNTQQYTISPGVGTNYTITVTDTNGCSSTLANIIVTVHPALQLLPPTTAILCEGDQVTLHVQANGGNGGPYSYSWNNGMTGPSIVVSPAQSTSYTVTLSDNCTLQPATAIIPVMIKSKPVVQFSSSNATGCIPVSVNFIDQSNSNVTSTFFWNFGDGTFSNDKNVTHTYTQPGNYNVSHTVTDSAGCSATFNVINAVSVFPFAEASFSFTPKSPATINAPISFEDKSVNAALWLWNFGDNSGRSNLKNPLYTYKDTGEYTISLITISSHGCPDTTYKKIIINGESIIYIPNSFTPNGDNINDGFIPISTGISQFEMYIFDRWGLQIYHTRDPHSPWNGKVQGHDLTVQNDVYVYKIYTTEVSGETHEYIGAVTIVK